MVSRPIKGAERPADGTIVVGQKRQRLAADFGVLGDVIGRRGENAPHNQSILIKERGFVEQRREFLLDTRIGRRTQEAENDPAPGMNVENKRRAADERRTQPRNLRFSVVVLSATSV
jgi:hypothetical protein